MHQMILDRIDLERLKRLTTEQFKHELALLIQRIIEEERIVLNQNERHNLVLDIQHEMLGFGPLEPLLNDPTVSDILVNTHAKVYVERRGKLELTDVTFHDNAHLMKIIEKIVSRVGRRVDESSPMVDARLPDGSRVNAIIPPLAVDGPILSIRRFSATPLTVQNLLDYKSMTPPMVQVLRGARPGQDQHPDLGRHRQRQDHAAEPDLRLHPRQRAHRDDRGRGRTAAAPAARGAPRNAPAQHRRQGRSDAARAGAQRAAHAPRPHHPGRGARRRGARHAAGDEHRPRRLARHDPLEHAARRAVAAGEHGRHGRRQPDRRARCASRSARPSRWCCR